MHFEDYNNDYLRCGVSRLLYAGGIWIGELLGKLIGIPANVGGVGIAMLLLIGLGSYLNKSGWLKGKTEQGVEFWSAIYIPIVVAMAAQQNVYGALRAGRWRFWQGRWR